MNTRKHCSIDVLQVESAVVASFVELASKLNDGTFKPFFRRLYDWAFVNESSSEFLSRISESAHGSVFSQARLKDR